MSDRRDDRIVWVDCEMTGLDLVTDALVEVAAVVTDSDGTALDGGVQVLIKPPPAALAGMAQIVQDMHVASGLLDALESATLSLAEAEDLVLAYVMGHVAEPRRVPLAGNSVATDRAFLARDMPRLEQHLHYRIIDVSSIKELCRRWYPRVYFQAPAKSGNHRALGDILDSIDELRYYRSALFVPQPGPDSTTARGIAERVLKARPSVRVQTGTTPSAQAEDPPAPAT